MLKAIQPDHIQTPNHTGALPQGATLQYPPDKRDLSLQITRDLIRCHPEDLLSQVQDTRQDRIAQEDPHLIAADLSLAAAIPPDQAAALHQVHQAAALPDHQDLPAEVHPEAAGKES
jgi:hypothetical protein